MGGGVRSPLWQGSVTANARFREKFRQTRRRPSAFDLAGSGYQAER
jgi:hypothetical protein